MEDISGNVCQMWPSYLAWMWHSVEFSLNMYLHAIMFYKDHRYKDQPVFMKNLMTKFFDIQKENFPKFLAYEIF